VLALSRLVRGSGRESGRARSGVGVGSGGRASASQSGVQDRRAARRGAALGFSRHAASHLAGLGCEVGAVPTRRAVDRRGECLELLRLQPGWQHHDAVRLSRLGLRVSSGFWVRLWGRTRPRPDPDPTPTRPRPAPTRPRPGPDPSPNYRATAPRASKSAAARRAHASPPAPSAWSASSASGGAVMGAVPSRGGGGAARGGAASSRPCSLGAPGQVRASGSGLGGRCASLRTADLGVCRIGCGEGRGHGAPQRARGLGVRARGLGVRARGLGVRARGLGVRARGSGLSPKKTCVALQMSSGMQRRAAAYEASAAAAPG
jgi:hypothetical protein